MKRCALTLAALATIALVLGQARAVPGVRLSRVSDDSFLAYAEPAVAADPTNPHRLLAVAQAIPTATPDGSRRQLVAYASDDGGATWQPSGPLTGSTPDLLGLDVTSAFDHHGTAYVLGEEQSPNGGAAPLLLWRSRDGGRTFDRPLTVASDAAARCCDHGWLRISAGGVLQVAYTGPGDAVDAIRSTDGGRHWRRPRALGSGLAPVVATAGRATVAVAWLSNGVHVRVSHDDGATFGQDRVLPGRPADGFPALAGDARTGRLYAASTVRGRVTLWTSADGTHWSAPHAVAGVSTGSQPQLAVAADRSVWTFLFTGRSSVAPALAHAHAALVAGSGRARRLTAPFPLTAGFGRGKGHAGGFVGDYQALTTDANEAVAVWNDGRSGGLQLTAATMLSG